MSRNTKTVTTNFVRSDFLSWSFVEVVDFEKARWTSRPHFNTFMPLNQSIGAYIHATKPKVLERCYQLLRNSLNESSDVKKKIEPTISPILFKNM